MNILCRLFGHKYDYEFKDYRKNTRCLVCVRCGKRLIII